MKHRLIEGRLEYTSQKPGIEGRSRGFETFMFTRHADGKVTLRAHCEIEEPEPTVMRDVIYSIDEHGSPMDLHVRLTVGDAFMGSGWLRFDGEMIECESYGPSIGRLSQQVKAQLPVDGFGTHPIVADGYLLSTKAWEVGQRQTFTCTCLRRITVAQPRRKSRTCGSTDCSSDGSRLRLPPVLLLRVTSSSSTMAPAALRANTRRTTCGSPMTRTAFS
jgi:hypothetical protein